METILVTGGLYNKVVDSATTCEGAAELGRASGGLIQNANQYNPLENPPLLVAHKTTHLFYTVLYKSA